MKIIAVGDLHGRNTWKQIASENNYDKIILIGDYFDTHEEISAESQQENFRELILFKRESPDRVILLLGNHDYHYLNFVYEHYTGFQSRHHLPIQELLHEALNENLLQVCYVHGNIAFTHAGLTKTWCIDNNIDMKKPEQQVNDLFRQTPAAFRFTPGNNYDSTGDDITQSPIWVRPKSLYRDKIEGYVQVVGHTRQEKISISDGIVLIDTLGSSAEYLMVEDGEISVRSSYS